VDIVFNAYLLSTILFGGLRSISVQVRSCWWWLELFIEHLYLDFHLIYCLWSLLPLSIRRCFTGVGINFISLHNRNWNICIRSIRFVWAVYWIWKWSVLCQWFCLPLFFQFNLFIFTNCILLSLWSIILVIRPLQVHKVPLKMIQFIFLFLNYLIKDYILILLKLWLVKARLVIFLR